MRYALKPLTVNMRTSPADSLVRESRTLFEQAFDYQLAHPHVVMRFNPHVGLSPDWVEIDSRIGLYETQSGRILRTPLRAEHWDGETVALNACGARAHVNSAGWRMLTHLEHCTDPAKLRRVWLQSLRRPAPPMEPHEDRKRARLFDTVADALA